MAHGRFLAVFVVLGGLALLVGGCDDKEASTAPSTTEVDAGNNPGQEDATVPQPDVGDAPVLNPDTGTGEEPDADAGLPPVCGDLLINQVGEECDDGNRIGNDGCTAACKREPLFDCPATGGPCTPQMVCGDLKITAIEQCDDGNANPGDGCSARCQVEAAYYVCPNTDGVGGPCFSTVACGDGKVEAGEICDDLNNVGGDGCAADCFSVEPGWICRKPGAPCTPQCGDTMILPGYEECDDGNTVNDDGCSTSCRIEPGYLCSGTPSVCTQTVCGDGNPEGTEICDLGDDNGLFYGDGSGCSKACTREPACRDPGGGPTRACDVVCGDGMLLGAEECDDGNLVNLDGCSDQCLIEDGFQCTTFPQSDVEPCPEGGGDCLILPVILRDFKGQNESGGHPDFFYMGANGIDGKTVCVPNAGCDPADPDCPDPASDLTPWCTGLVQDSLGNNGKPVYGGAVDCECIFTDWDDTGVLGSAATGTNADGKQMYEGSVQMIESAESFAQWYTDVPGVNTTVRSVLALEEGGGVYQFTSSNGRTVLDDIHDGDDLESGFFPLEDQTGAKLCNLWPYWADWPASCSGDQWDPEGEETVAADGVERNFYFTTEARYLMVYQGGESLEFYGDDDVWVFVNGHLALDLGGTHQQLLGSVTLASGGDPRYGLEPGNVYEIVVFHADRHPRDSNYQLTLSGFETERSDCLPECGNGVATLTEQCDLGAENDDNAYGGCRTDCTWGPFCGDGVPNGPEICDDGVNVTLEYGAEGCAPGCVPPPKCGDGVVQGAEQCDDGPNNQDGVEGACSTACLINPRCGDGVVMIESGEECDLGPGNAPPDQVTYGGCTTECRLGPHCGDGVTDRPDEQCDDGNYTPFDGCSPICLLYELPR
ncbi:MAG: DUF4215 domain-containing protein [Polyangiaceae bacterium]|nr:DUF4215 domain-containing protein [Polyangiaceae bacterium]